MESNSDLVLITGATGYIGSHIARKLLEEGFRIRVAARKVSSSPKVEQFRKTFAEFDGKFEFIEADLLDKSVDWSQLAKGCQYVMHVASSFPENVPKNEAEANVILQTAVDGTKAVVEGVAKEKSVKKLVITSSVASIAALCGTKGRVYTESDWFDADAAPRSQTYERSKTLAERAAWDMYKEMENPHFALVCVNPSVVIGPSLVGYSTSLNLLKALFTREAPLLPQVSVALVDVRDVASVHVRLLGTDELDGERVIANAGTVTMREVARVVAKHFGCHGYSIPVRTAPDWLFRVVSYFNSQVAPLLPSLGKETVYDNSRMRQVLKVEPIDLETSIVETGHSLISQGFVRMTHQYEMHMNSLEQLGEQEETEGEQEQKEEEQEQKEQEQKEQEQKEKEQEQKEKEKEQKEELKEKEKEQNNQEQVQKEQEQKQEQEQREQEQREQEQREKEQREQEQKQKQEQEQREREQREQEQREQEQREQEQREREQREQEEHKEQQETQEEPQEQQEEQEEHKEQQENQEEQKEQQDEHKEQQEKQEEQQEEHKEQEEQQEIPDKRETQPDVQQDCAKPQEKAEEKEE